MSDHFLESRRIGKALASQSHELKNVLAIVGESVGLMEDLLEMAQSKGVALPDTVSPAFERSMNAITAQVARGHKLCTDLNILAHMSDWREQGKEPLVDLGEVGALAARYMERPARQNQVTLLAPEACDRKAAADPVALLTALMALLECSWQALDPDSSLRLLAVPGSLALDIDPAPVAESLTDEVRSMLAMARLELEENNGRLRVSLKEGQS